MDDELCVRGKPKMVAIGVLMRKRVHCFYCVLTGTAFCDEIFPSPIHI